MVIDWKALEDQYGSFKPQAPEGKYKVTINAIEVKSLDSGAIAVTFKFKNSAEYSFPWATHWISMNNRGWTQWHHKQLLEVFGVRKEDAMKAIDNAEDKAGDNANLVVSAYEAIYKKIALKHPEVEIVVRPQYDQDGNYRYSQKGYQQFESEFTDSRVFSDNTPVKVDGVHAERVEKPADTEPAAEEEMNLDEIPF